MYKYQGDRTDYKLSQLIKIKTQIRAQLNNLRRTYQKSETLNMKRDQKKHFLSKLCKETLKEPDPNIINKENKSLSKGKKKIQPVNSPDPQGFKVERRHYPTKYKDTISLSFHRLRRSSSFLIRRQSSTTPQKDGKSILSFIWEKQNVKERPTKRIMPSFHTFTKQFF